MTSLFGGYEHEGFFDEFMDERGEVRPHYRQLALRLGALSPDELARRERLRDAAFRSAGITFTVYGEDAGLERTFPMDLVPRIIPAAEWAHVEQGLAQRVTALNMFLDDLYVGERAAVKDGIVPMSLITSSDGFEREAFGIPVPQGRPVPRRRHRPRARRRTARTACSRTTCATRAASPTCSRTARR